MGCVPTKRRAIRQPIRPMSVRNSAVRNSAVEPVQTKMSGQDMAVIQSVPTTVTVPMVAQPSNTPEPVINVAPPAYSQQPPTMAMLPPVVSPQPPLPPSAQVLRPNSPLPMENPQFGRPQSMHPQIMYPQSQQIALPPRPTSPYGPPMTMGSQRNYIPNIPTMQPIFQQPAPLVHQMSPNSLSSTASPRSLKFDPMSQRSVAPNFGNPGFQTSENAIPSIVPSIPQMSSIPAVTQVSHMSYSPMVHPQSSSNIPPPLNVPIPTMTNVSVGPMNSPRSNLPVQNASSRYMIEQPPPMPILSNNINHNQYSQNNAEILIELNRESADVNDENFQEIKIEKMDFGTTKAY